MNRSQQPALTLFAIGMIGLGILALIYGDFALVWQPVAPWIPGRTILAYGAGLIMLFGGIGLLLATTAAWSIRILFPYLHCCLAPAEGTRSAGGAADGSGLARLWRTCCAYDWRSRYLFAQAGRAATGIAAVIRHRPPGARVLLWGLSHTDRALTSCICEGDELSWYQRGFLIGLAAAYLTGMRDGSLLPELEAVPVRDLPAHGRARGSGHGQPVYASRLGSCDSCSADGTAAVDGIFHLVGHRVRRMGSGPKTSHPERPARPAMRDPGVALPREIWYGGAWTRTADLRIMRPSL